MAQDSTETLRHLVHCYVLSIIIGAIEIDRREGLEIALCGILNHRSLLETDCQVEEAWVVLRMRVIIEKDSLAVRCNIHESFMAVDNGRR